MALPACMTRLTIHFGPAFTQALWCWKVTLAEASSGRVEVEWRTSTVEAEREHRSRARTMPDWWPELRGALAQVEFDLLPPSKNWTNVMDDAATLHVALLQDDRSSVFSIFYAPKLWPPLPERTRSAIQQVVVTLDPIARSLHAS